ncbi:olfactory receptor 11A1-like [Parambassis ranga]|uniref:Olfactory receptor n=1 Tax=Parambassis ranga TaxID=210632 RepID=A0A6P7JGK9_9TELE|nr:olfactory receptor 11A1-like [Parambassis ranga]
MRMMNSTQFSYFRLAAYFDVGLFRYVCFMVVLALYAVIVAANVLLIVVICVNRSLHEPMYMFLCSLFVNELYGSVSVFPLILVQILSDVHTVSTFFSYIQIYVLHCYGTVEYVNLAVMSYDRYLAICYPLQYSTRMSSKKIAALIALTWVYGVLICAVMISLSSSLQLCGNIIYKVYCDNYSVVKLACSDTSIINMYGLFISFTTLGCPLVFIFFTYMKILAVCFSGSKRMRQKAVSTCTPHLASVLNFSFGASFELIQSRFNMSSLPIMLRIFASLYWLTAQPLFNPLVYGLNLSKIRILCKSLFFADV